MYRHNEKQRRYSIPKPLAASLIIVFLGSLVFHTFFANNLLVARVSSPGIIAKVPTGWQSSSNKNLKTSTGTIKDTAIQNRVFDNTTSIAAQDGTCITNATYTSNVISSDPILQKLRQYQNVCSTAIVNTASFFSGMPRTTNEAESLAYDVSQSLKNFAAYGVRPIVIVEPMYGDAMLDLESMSNGAYDEVYTYFLQSLIRRGINNANIGTWVLFPEANIPEWSTVNQGVYVANVTRFGTMLKNTFSSAKLSLLLDSTTYESNSYNGPGKRVSLLPYINSIPHGLVDMFGLQGFPWAPPAGSNDITVSDANIFLPASLAIEAANSLGIKDIWFNSGTYSVFYAGSSTKRVLASAAQRQSTLNTIIGQLKTASAQGFNVSMHIFAENKANSSEGVDWSYWHTSPNEAGNNTSVFVDFANKLANQGIDLWVFDSF